MGDDALLNAEPSVQQTLSQFMALIFRQMTSTALGKEFKLK